MGAKRKITTLLKKKKKSRYIAISIFDVASQRAIGAFTICHAIFWAMLHTIATAQTVARPIVKEA